MTDWIFDLDGTLADSRHRAHFWKPGPGIKTNWKEFTAHHQIMADQLILPVANLAKLLYDRGDRIIIVTARDCRSIESTKTWLEEHSIKYHALFHRQEGDPRDDEDVKEDLYHQLVHAGFDPFGVFDDRPSVVKKWRELGLFVFDVKQNPKEDY